MGISVLSLYSIAQPSQTCSPHSSKGILQQMFRKQLWEAPGAHQNSFKLLLPARCLQHLWAEAPCGIQGGLSEVLGKGYKTVSSMARAQPLWL